MYSMSSLIASDAIYCLNDMEVKKISKALQDIKFCETDLERLKILQSKNESLFNPDITVYKTDDLIISFSLGTFFGILIYNKLENNRIVKKWL